MQLFVLVISVSVIAHVIIVSMLELITYVYVLYK